MPGRVMTIKKEIQGLLSAYVNKRPPHILRCICVLFDVRSPISNEDDDLLKALDKIHKPYLVVFTKVDKINPEDLFKIVEETEIKLQKHAKCWPEIVSTSSILNLGFDRLKAFIMLASQLDNVKIQKK